MDFCVGLVIEESSISYKYKTALRNFVRRMVDVHEGRKERRV